MAQPQRVSWRTASYAALGSIVAAASVVVLVHSDGVHPTSLTSSAATRWLVYQPSQLLVLADGLSGRVLAKIDAKSDASGEVAVQGAGGAFLVAPSQGSVRAISTAKLQLGTPQPVASLSEAGVSAQFGVGPSGLTVMNSATDEANVVAADDIARPIRVPKSDFSRIAADGSLWLFTSSLVKHVNVDESTTSMPLRGEVANNLTTTVGPHAVSFDSRARIVRWLDGRDVSVASIPNVADAVLQEPGDDAPCVWLGAGDTLACVGATAIDHTIQIPGMGLGTDDRLAIAGSAAVVVRHNREIFRLDLDGMRLPIDSTPTVPANAARVKITATNDLIWIDDEPGDFAWVVHRFGINTINKNDDVAPLLDAQGQLKPGASGAGSPNSVSGNQPSEVADVSHLDGNGHDDPPVAVADSVTARAGTTVTIPVTANDYDPDGDAIAVVGVGSVKAEHGTTDVLNGTTVAYVPDRDFSGSDSFSYTIVDEHNNEQSALVTVQLFPVDSPNQPPIARPDHVKTRLGRPITIDVLANDIDPERDVLSVPTFRQSGNAKITDTTGPTRLPALLYDPPPSGPGIYTFTYQAADPQGGTSQETTVTVDVSGANTANEAPVANPDAIRLPVGVAVPLNVKANDVDPDGDELTIALATTATKGVTVKLKGQQLAITLQPGAPDRSVIFYTLRDGIPGHEQAGHVLVLRIGDTAENRPPVANPDAERVVIASSVKIPVTANDIDPDHDLIRLVSVEQPADGAGTTTVEGNSVRFIPNLPNITEPTPVTFGYRIGDGHNHEVAGKVTVTVLAEALPRAPFARDDFADTVADKPVNIDVLANDSDPSGGRPNLFGDLVCPNGGSARATDDERVTFDPPAHLTGTFRCKYTVVNTQRLMAEATIIVDVTAAPPGNRDPELDSAALLRVVNVGDSIEFDAGILANDPDHDSLVFAAVGKPTSGVITTSQQQDTFVYTAPPHGATDKTPLADSIDITISDGHDGNVHGTISIRIVDTAIPFTKPGTHEISRQILLGDTASVNVPLELRDDNPGSTLTVLSAIRDAGSADAQVDLAGGVVAVTPAAAGTVSVTYVVANSDQQTQSGRIKVIVSDRPVDNPPPVAVDDVLEVPSFGVNRVNILANDSGIGDIGDKTPSVFIVSRPLTSFGSVDVSNGILTFTAAPDAAGVGYVRYTVNDGTTVSPAGTVTITIQPCLLSPPSAALGARIFTPYQTPLDIDLTQYVTSGSIRPGSVAGAGLTGPTGRYTPPTGMNGSETVNYTVENGCGQTTQATLTIDVNRVPVGGTIDRNLARGDTLTLLVGDLASDDEPLHITTVNGNPAWVSFDGTAISATPPTTTPSGVYTVTATVADPGGLTATATIHMAISNLAPIAVADAYTSQTSPFSFNPIDNDSDPEGGPVHVQTIAWIDGSGPIVRSGDLITVPLGHGVSTLSYTIVDDGGMTATSTVTITYNRPPAVADVIADPTNQPTIEVHLAPTDPDGDPLVVTCSPTPDFEVLVSSDPFGQVDLHITVLNGFLGTATFPCTVTDTFNATATATVTVTITS